MPVRYEMTYIRSRHDQDEFDSGGRRKNKRCRFPLSKSAAWIICSTTTTTRTYDDDSHAAHCVWAELLLDTLGRRTRMDVFVKAAATASDFNNNSNSLSDLLLSPIVSVPNSIVEPPTQYRPAAFKAVLVPDFNCCSRYLVHFWWSNVGSSSSSRGQDHPNGLWLLTNDESRGCWLLVYT